MDQPSLPVSIKRFLNMVANFFDAHTAALFISKEDGQHLDLVACHSLSRHIVPHCQVKQGQGLIGWIAKENRPLHVTRFTKFTNTLGIYTKNVGIKAFLGAPLPDNLGVLMVDSKSQWAFPEKQEKILQDCAAVAADLWKNFLNERKYALLQRWTELQCRFPTTFDKVLFELLDMFGMEEGFCAKLDPNQKSYEVKSTVLNGEFVTLRPVQFRQDAGLAGWIFKHKRNIVLKQFRADKKRSFFIWPEEPFEGGPMVIGMYAKDNHSGEYAWILSGSGHKLPEDILGDFIESMSARLGELISNIK